MKNINYKKYTKKQMLKIIINEGFFFVETDLGDNYIIRKNDLADFLILETERTEHSANFNVFIPGIDKPVITTFGWFLNKANPTLRDEILPRLVELQTGQIKPKKVKIFDNMEFNGLSREEMGIQDNEIKNFDKLYGKYVIN